MTQGIIPIVATMLTANAEEIVLPAIQSVLPWCDILLLIDTGVTDQTVEIAKSTAKDKFRVVSWPWQKDFSKARNYSLQAAAEVAGGTCWAVTIDTDERLFFPGFSSIESLRNKLCENSKINVWLVPYANGFYTKDRFARVPHSELRWEGRTHEALVGFQPSERIELTGSYFEELPKSPEQFRRKLERDLEVLAEETRDKPNDARWWYYLGQTHEELKDLPNAVLAFEKSGSLTGWPEQIAWSCFKAASCYSMMKTHRNAIEWCTRGLAVQSSSPELAWLAAFSAYELGDDHSAISWAIMASAIGNWNGIEAGVPRIGFRHLPGWYEGPFDVMRHAYRRLGQVNKAANAEKQFHAALNERQRAQPSPQTGK